MSEAVLLLTTRIGALQMDYLLVESCLLRDRLNRPCDVNATQAVSVDRRRAGRLMRTIRQIAGSALRRLPGTR